MKKTALFGIIAMIFISASNLTAYAAQEVAIPDIPSDFLNSAKWPFTHTESCMPAGKEYRSTAYAKITNDKKMESVLTTSLDGTIFHYEYIKKRSEAGFRFCIYQNGKRMDAI